MQLCVCVVGTFSVLVSAVELFPRFVVDVGVSLVSLVLEAGAVEDMLVVLVADKSVKKQEMMMAFIFASIVQK